MESFYRFFLVCVFSPLLMMGGTDFQSLTSCMLSDFKTCFSGELTPKQLINEWRWGGINLAFVFNFAHMLPENQLLCWVFAACPSSGDRNRDFPFKEFPRVNDLWRENTHPYLTFGVRKNQAEGKQSLSFVYCSKKSDIYRHFLNLLDLCEPSYEEARMKHPTQCWDTFVYDKEKFQHSPIDDQFVRWDALNPEIVVVYRYNQQQCMGVMLIRRDVISPIGGTCESNRLAGTLNLSKFDETFRWIPDYKVERFAEEATNYLKTAQARGREVRIENVYFKPLNNLMMKYKENNELFQNQKLRHFGVMHMPSDENLNIPWKQFSYYKSFHSAVFLRSKTEWHFEPERFDSFVLDIEKIDDGVQVLLPNGLDIKPYLRTYPVANVVYEHIRADKCSRIIVQPYIAYLYENDRLAKILVCGNKNGPADHGWCLVRNYYCYEEYKCNEGSEWYYWPVRRAYFPAGL